MTTVQPLDDAASGVRRATRTRFWTAVVLTGVAAGAVGIGVTELLHLVQHLAFGYTENTFLHGVEQASAGRRVGVLLLAGVLGGAGWLLLRRLTTVRSVARATDPHDPHPLPVGVTTADGLLQIAVVGMGASLGREGAPRQIAAALGGRLAERLGLDAAGRRLVLAAGAGAGLAAVYNVPFSGGLFAVEIVLGSFAIRSVAAALLCSGIATGVSWLVLPNVSTYRIAPVPLHASVVAFAVVVGPLAGVLGGGFARLMSLARRRIPTGAGLPAAMVVAFGALGVAAVRFPQLLGNGKGPTDLALTGALGAGTALTLVVLKPLATAACLRSGAAGGLLTPALATGALFGAVAGTAWAHAWPGTPAAGYALVGATAVLAVTQRAPLCAVALGLEFTHAGAGALLPLAVASALAFATGRVVTPAAADRST